MPAVRAALIDAAQTSLRVINAVAFSLFTLRGASVNKFSKRMEL